MNENEMTKDERGALRNMRKEAKLRGATLHDNGEGGLPSSLVLGVMRRDKYKCKRCGTRKDLTMHHKGHLKNPTSRWLAKKGRESDPNNIVTLCVNCHDAIHQEDEKEGAQ
jgi:5-methylcytosine-specific restriction endonuclease McrA